ncbi:MAG: inositol monophosphatase family protein [bacterium]
MKQEQKDTYEDFLNFALFLSEVAEHRIMPYYQNCLVEMKPDGTEVTRADREAEKAIGEMIQRRFPEHAILGEEFGETNPGQSPYRWIIDPLDGTTVFSLGTPNFGTLVALLKNDEPIVGVIHLPVLHETVCAAKGLGCWFRVADRDPVPVKVRSTTRLKDAIASSCGVHGSDIFLDNGDVPYNLTALIHQVKKFRFLGDCTQHALVCRGRIDLAIDTVMMPWDIAAIIPCIREAGGVASTLSGDQHGVVFGGSLIISCHTSLHEEALDLLQPKPYRNGL